MSHVIFFINQIQILNMKKIILRFKNQLLLIAVITCSISFTACNSTKEKTPESPPQTTVPDSTGSNTQVATYQCPMDCEKGKTYNAPGQCPVCGMDLEQKQ